MQECSVGKAAVWSWGKGKDKKKERKEWSYNLEWLFLTCFYVLCIFRRPDYANSTNELPKTASFSADMGGLTSQHGSRNMGIWLCFMFRS